MATWLRELTPRGSLEVVGDRAVAARDLVRQLNEKLYKRYLADPGKGMKPEDVQELRDWMDDYADQHVAEAAEQMSDGERHYFEQAVLRIARVDQVRMTVWGMILWRGKLPMPSEEDFRRLVAMLSPDEVRLYEMVKNNKDQRDELLRIGRAPPPPPTFSAVAAVVRNQRRKICRSSSPACRRKSGRNS